MSDNDAKIFFEKALKFFKEKKFEKKKKNFEDALKLAPGRVSILENLASIFFNGSSEILLMNLPLAIGGVCILASIIGTYFVKLSKNGTVMGALYKGFIVSALLALVGIYVVIDFFVGMDFTFSSSNGDFSGADIFYCSIVVQSKN